MKESFKKSLQRVKDSVLSGFMKLYHMTKHSLLNRLQELKAYQSNCEDDFDYCEVYQREIDEVEECLYSGKCGSYVMDNQNFTEEL